MVVTWAACCAYLFVQQVHEPGLKFVHFGLGVLHFAAMKTRKKLRETNFASLPLLNNGCIDCTIIDDTSIDTFIEYCWL